MLEGPKRTLGWTAREIELVEQTSGRDVDLCLRVKEAGMDWVTLRCVDARHRTLAAYDEAGCPWLYSGDEGTFWYWIDSKAVWHEVVYEKHGVPERPQPPPEMREMLRTW